jgi:hypothetical protein
MCARNLKLATYGFQHLHPNQSAHPSPWTKGAAKARKVRAGATTTCKGRFRNTIAGALNQLGPSSADPPAEQVSL